MILSKRMRVLLRRLRQFFFTTLLGGIVVVLPITLLIWLIRLIVAFVSSLLAPMRELFSFAQNIPLWVVDTMSFVIVILLFFLFGLFVRTRFGHELVNSFEQRWLMPLPFYPTLRETVRQFLSSDKTPFSQVVLVDVFGSGTLMTGFIADENGNGWYTVFVPTGPNPTNGFIFHVKREQLQFVDTKMEDAMRTIIGVGLGSSILFKR